jgi:hypothetical protein
MARSLKNKSPEEYSTVANAVLEHHFDNHEYCGDWCKRKNETEEQRKSSVKYYRCKERDQKLYALLQKTIARFVTQERLQDMAHNLDTNVNEAFNQICTWFLLKNKVFAGSCSLHNCIGFAVGINLIGVTEYFRRLYRKLGITMTPNVQHYLKLKESNRRKKLDKMKTAEAKKDKNKRKYDKLAEDTRKAKKELYTRQGIYRRGINLDLPIAEIQDNVVPVPKKKASAASHCEYCGKKGHATHRSKKCTALPGSEKLYRKNGMLRTDPDIEEPSDVDDALDCLKFDSMPLVPGAEEAMRFDEEEGANEVTPIEEYLRYAGDDEDSEDEAAGPYVL